MNFDSVPSVPFWALYFLAWLVVAMLATWLVAKWVDSHNPKRRHRISSVDFDRCERAGSQASFTRRLRSGGVR